MARGAGALVALLFLITAAVVVASGALGALVCRNIPTGEGIWQSLMHALDAGTLAGDDPGNPGFVALMSVVTLCGIFVTSLLIGILSTGLEQKLNALRKGVSKVVESGHTVIIGFGEGTYTLLSELIEAGANQKHSCVVVLGERDKEEMEELIRGHVKDFKTTRVIVRSGKPTEDFLLARASLETSKSIIVNQEDDFSVLKVILAATNYLKARDAFEGGPHITAMIRAQENLDAARIAGEGVAEVLYFESALSRIVAHTCRQPGLSRVLTEFFDFGGDEFYFEHFPELKGLRFGDALGLFECSAAVGLEHGGQVMLNPPMDLVIGAEDRIILLAEDDGVSKPGKRASEADLSVEAEAADPAGAVGGPLLVLGVNPLLPEVLRELDRCSASGTQVRVAGCEIPSGLIDGPFENIAVEGVACDICQRDQLEHLVRGGVQDILLLSDQDCEGDADAETLLLLIQLRDIGRKTGRSFNLTSEMRSVENQRLATVANVNDFVVGSTITNLMIAQISENRKLALLFDDLLDADGSELYMKKACRYVKPGVTTDFYAVTEIARRRGEIAVGYKVVAPEGIRIVTNPKKSERVTFGEEDCLIVIAQDAL
jgi:voltage-gated potassium channel Kch